MLKNRKVITNIGSVFILAVYFFLGVASHANKAVFSDANNFIPSDFNPSSGVLLIQKHPQNEKQNDAMIDFLNDNYPYNFEVVEKEVIESRSGKYADQKKYHFAVLWKDRGSPSAGTWTNFDLYGHFVDRVTNKEYPESKSSNVYGREGYKPFINAVVKKFQ